MTDNFVDLQAKKVDRKFEPEPDCSTLTYKSLRMKRGKGPRIGVSFASSSALPTINDSNWIDKKRSSNASKGPGRSL